MERPRPKNEPKRDNPFSFRNFLTSDNVARPVISQSNSIQIQNEPSTHSRTSNPYSFARFIQNPQPRPTNTVRADNTILIQGELPDFVQDHVASNGNATDELMGNPAGLPDFTLHISNNLEAQASSELTENLIDDSSSRNVLSGSANLPDFLSGTGLNLAGAESQEMMAGNGNGVIEEDSELVSRISELEATLLRKELRIAELQAEIRDRDKKEEEETEIMEGVLREVNDNLNRALERWHSSEAEVDGLKTRIRHLEFQLDLKSDKRNGGFVPMHLVRDLGRQLSSDLFVADNVLRGLLEHSDKLKLVAGHLQYLDRVTEDKANESSSSTNIHQHNEASGTTNTNTSSNSHQHQYHNSTPDPASSASPDLHNNTSSPHPPTSSPSSASSSSKSSPSNRAANSGPPPSPPPPPA